MDVNTYVRYQKSIRAHAPGIQRGETFTHEFVLKMDLLLTSLLRGEVALLYGSLYVFSLVVYADCLPGIQRPMIVCVTHGWEHLFLAKGS